MNLLKKGLRELEEKNLTFEEIEKLIQEKSLELLEDAKYLDFIKHEMHQLSEKYDERK